MHTLIELEGRLISIETKEIEINGNPVLTPGKIVVYNPPLVTEHLKPLGKPLSITRQSWYQAPKSTPTPSGQTPETTKQNSLHI